VDPVPDPLLLFVVPGNRTWDPWICSQELEHVQRCVDGKTVLPVKTGSSGYYYTWQTTNNILGICTRVSKSQICYVQLSDKMSLFHYNVSSSENFQITASAMHSSTQTTKAISILMTVSTNVNHFVIKISLSSSAHSEKPNL
jgi:hypothetical protein